jgi:hypothetical protein
MEYNIVTNFRINTIFKQKSKYYKVSLGYTSTQEANGGERNYNKKDEFAYFYNTRYRTTIQCQGSIGNIKFYTDHYITQPQLAFYFDKEEYIFDFDEEIVNSKGVDFYLGHLIKTIETEKKDEADKKVVEETPVDESNPKLVAFNPGAVKYTDLKAYLDQKNANRLNI